MPEGWIGLELSQKTFVGGRKFKFLQLRGVDPPEIGATKRLRLTPEPYAPIKVQANGLFRIGVGKALNKRIDGNIDSELFLQFAYQTVFEALARLAFAAREFPQSAQVRAGVPPGNQ